MSRLKKLKFDSYVDLLSYHKENDEFVYDYTLNKLKKYWDKHQNINDIDIFEVCVKDLPSFKYISLESSEWGLYLDEIMGWAESTENYNLAIIARDLSREIYGCLEEA